MPFTNFFIGLALFTLGWLAVLVPIPFLTTIVYPMLWWGFILVIDSVNFLRWKESPIKSHAKHFFGIILPLSTIYWLYFELVNFYYSQWHYLGVTPAILPNALLSFISFATVIPAITEIFWIFNGPLKEVNGSRRRSILWFLAGVLFAVLPFFSGNFILNQLIWIAPFLLFFPFLKSLTLNAKFFLFASLSGLISGVLWEFFNFWATAKWQYFILPEAFRIFEMPVLGYLGFIPFAFSTVAIYLFAKEYFKSKIFTILLLYALALAFSYLFILKIA